MATAVPSSFVRIAEVIEDSPADLACVEEGEILVAIDGATVRTEEDATAAMVAFHRSKGREYITLTLRPNATPGGEYGRTVPMRPGESCGIIPMSFTSLGIFVAPSGTCHGGVLADGSMLNDGILDPAADAAGSAEGCSSCGAAKSCGGGVAEACGTDGDCGKEKGGDEACRGAAAAAGLGLVGKDAELVEAVAELGQDWEAVADRVGIDPIAALARFTELRGVIRKRLAAKPEMPCGHTCGTCPTRDDCKLHDAVEEPPPARIDCRVPLTAAA